MSVLEYEAKVQPSGLLKYDSQQGTGTALFSRYFAEDADGDYTTDTFLPHGVTVPMLIGHVWSETPVGKGKIRSTDTAAYYDFTLADTARGRELAEWLRFDMADGQPKSQFSYGFKILPGGSSYEVINGKRLRVLHGQKDGSGAGARVMEVSYVLAGSGVGTQLVSMKAEQRYRWGRRLAELEAISAARHRADQATYEAMYQGFLQRERERVR